MVSHPGLLRIIALGKLTKAVLLLVLGVATINLRHRDVTEVLGAWVDQLHLDPGGRIVHAVVERTSDVRPGRLIAVGTGMLVYAALLTIEGAGLLLGQRWAEYFTVVVTGSFVPLELYEIARHPTVTRGTALAVNLVVVGYLVFRLRRTDT